MPEFLDPLRAIVVGGGFSGTLVAIHLLRQPRAAQIELVDARIPGRGLAYSTVWDDHLLNVPAIRMSVFGSEPMHFLEWLHANGEPEADAGYFAPRKLYGTYLQHTLEAAVRAAGAKSILRHHVTEARRVWFDGEFAYAALGNGETLRGSKVVLACGNPMPRPLVRILPGYVGSPWEAGAFENIDPERDVLLVGSGLTAVDAFLALQAQGHRGKVYFLSRRGKLPQPHTPYPPLPEAFAPPGRLGARGLLRAIRRRVKDAQAENVNWRAVIDSMRPVTNDIWRQLESREQRRVLRHLKTWWDIHRHRMAPDIGTKIADAKSCGRLVVHAGHLQHLTANDEGLTAVVRLRSQEKMTLAVQRLINCTGSEEDYRNTENPLLRSLIASGCIVPHPIGKGLRTNEHGVVLDETGTATEWLLTLGPPRLGGLFETTAVPEIRRQAEALASYLMSVIYEPIEVMPELFMAAGI